MYVYQTDARGTRRKNNRTFPRPRLRATMRTAAWGYEFHTVSRLLPGTNTPITFTIRQSNGTQEKCRDCF